jgi:hypothetical protein
MLKCTKCPDLLQIYSVQYIQLAQRIVAWFISSWRRPQRPKPSQNHTLAIYLRVDLSHEFVDVRFGRDGAPVAATYTRLPSFSSHYSATVPHCSCNRSSPHPSLHFPTSQSPAEIYAAPTSTSSYRHSFIFSFLSCSSHGKFTCSSVSGAPHSREQRTLNLLYLILRVCFSRLDCIFYSFGLYCVFLHNFPGCVCRCMMS